MLTSSRIAVVPVLVAGALALGACGSDDKEPTEESAEKTASPRKAIEEIGETKAGLEKGLVAYKAGQPAKADEIVSETYLQHFEEVEGPLEQADPELTEKLESSISVQIRAQIKRKVPKAQLKELIKRTEADLDTAEAKLK